MKCMMSVDGSNIVRVSDERASELFSEGFRYVSKSLWKEKVRDTEIKSDEPPKPLKNNKLSKAQKRHIRKANRGK